MAARLLRFPLPLLLVTLLLPATASVDYDVVVYGSTPAGIGAATAAGQLGMRVALFEPLGMIGGMGAAGALGLHDEGGIHGGGRGGGGLATVWQMLNGKAYNVTKPVQQPESFVAEASFRTMLRNASVGVIKTDCHVIAAATAKGTDGASRIASISLSCEPKPITAVVFIDASYDGDVMTAAGDIEYTAGRESTAQYDESLAGAMAPGWVGVGGPRNISATKPDGSLLKYVQNITELGPPGSADDALMAFQHRLCISEGDNMVPWPKPPGYDPEDFLLMQRVIDATGSANSFTGMPPGGYRGPAGKAFPGGKNKYDLCCGITVAASDQPNINKGWANASWERRQEIIAEHTYFEMGTFFYLANDPKVPQKIRAKFQSHGLCKDEFAAFGHIPPQLYVRISNRLVGDFVMTQNNICVLHEEQSIALGDWPFDEHMTGKYAVPDGNGGHVVMLEGNYWPSIAQGCNNSASHYGPNSSRHDPYNVPYSAIVPKRGTGANLIVPVCFSASAVAYSSTRIETMFMYVGTAAGVAAKQVVDRSAKTVQDVNVAEVQRILVGTFDQIVHVPPLPPPSPPPSPPPPSPSTSYYNVSGAGSAQFNGRYQSESHGQYKSTTCEKCVLYAYGGVWRLAIDVVGAPNELVYVAGGPSKLPPPTGWTVAAKGTSPAPTVSGPPDAQWD